MDRTDTATTFAPEPEASSAWSRALNSSAKRGPRMTATDLMRLLGDPAKGVGIDAVPTTAGSRTRRDGKAPGN